MAIDEGWVGVEDVATHLRVAKDSVYRWVNTKGFPKWTSGSRPLTQVIRTLSQGVGKDEQEW